MRIWHQSFTDLTLMPLYGKTLTEHARQVCRPQGEVAIHGLKRGTYGRDFAPLDAIKYRYLESLNALQICDAVLEAERVGYSAVAIGCFFDPGLQVARSLVDIPVVSLAETCMLVGCSVARRFAIVTMSTDESAVLAELAERYGLSSRIATIVAMEPALDEYALEADEESGRDSEIAFEGACAVALERGAELVIPGDGVLNEFLFRRRRFATRGLPIMDSIGVLLRYAIMMADLRMLTGLMPARTGMYMKPPPSMLAYARRFAGQDATDESEFSSVATNIQSEHAAVPAATVSEDRQQTSEADTRD